VIVVTCKILELRRKFPILIEEFRFSRQDGVSLFGANIT
jgi:hypothetical protein